MLSYFKKTYCINLTSREDRLHRVSKEFEENGLSKFFQRFAAVNPKRHDYDPKYNKSIGPYHVVPNAGCLGSHRAIIKEAKEQGLENVLVFEDDVKFIGDKEAVSESINDLKNTDWGLFYLGATIEEEMKEVTPRLFQTKCAKATHAVAYSKKVYDDILNIVPEDINELLEFTCEYTAVDNFLIKEIQSKYQTFICNPMFAVQGRSFSDIVQMNIDYSYDQIRLFNENKPEEHFVENHK